MIMISILIKTILIINFFHHRAAPTLLVPRCEKHRVYERTLTHPRRPRSATASPATSSQPMRCFGGAGRWFNYPLCDGTRAANGWTRGKVYRPLIGAPRRETSENRYGPLSSSPSPAIRAHPPPLHPLLRLSRGFVHTWQTWSQNHRRWNYLGQQAGKEIEEEEGKLGRNKYI